MDVVDSLRSSSLARVCSVQNPMASDCDERIIKSRKESLSMTGEMFSSGSIVFVTIVSEVHYA